MTAMPWLQRGVERFMSEDRVALESFQRDHFGADSPLLDDTHFNWLFEEPPTPDPEGMQLWVCKRNGGIVGQQAGIPFALKVGQRVRRASWAIDLMVAPEWRLRGVGPGLSETHAAASEVSVSLSMTDAAYKSYKRAGWLDLGNIPTYLRVIDPPRCLRVSPYGGGLARLVARLGKPAMNAASLVGHAAARTFGARLVEVDRFDERMDGLWEAAAPQHLCAARRDHAYLQWRFDKIPNAARHRRFLVMRRDTVVAYVVLRVDRWRGERRGGLRLSGPSGLADARLRPAGRARPAGPAGRPGLPHAERAGRPSPVDDGLPLPEERSAPADPDDGPPRGRPSGADPADR
ncbi:GNAT family N-acetyltransferase [Azospirillum sp. Marseille-Q6669]